MKRKAPAKVSFPLVMSERGVSVTIYRTTSSKGGKHYVSYTLSWQTPEGRRRKVFGDFDDAKREAGAKLAGILSGRADSTLGLADAEFLTKARQESDRIGKPLFAILEEYAEAQKILAGRTGILSAAKYWDRHVGKVTPILVDTAYGEFLEARAKGSSPDHLKNLRERGKAFREAFACNVHEVDRASVRSWLEKHGTTPSAWNKRRETLSNFFGWCVDKGYISKDAAEEIMQVKKEVEESGEVLVYTPSEMRTILMGTEKVGPIREDLLPFVVLGAFAGIRPEGEFQRITWENVNFIERVIRLEKRQQKVKNAARTIPMQDNLVQWLAPYANHKGHIAPFKKLSQALRRRCEAVGVTYKENGLRHSYGTYRLAIVHSDAQVAREMGNSPDIIADHYDSRAASEAQAKDFWSVAPIREGNVIPMAGTA